ncbi:hypothetical protein BDM02DRAFT_3138753 [Thelephora ganbajun]|uniref:Uncharacterized protein n=1 Tax=Thelephora ganbajun TaxID=370292 RepID=A0ACB6ZQ90_THEGA|nr:hypothetical protein BDM02DRAFT_3138753 [Thelephora ganbajun]
MAHTVLYPAKNFFYPIGNTSAVVLTDTLTPEEPANLLLLGCGDPRNILFTVYNQADDTERTLDFTCCDVEPAVLARNVLLLAMITDNEPSNEVLAKIWNSFFHFFFDEKSRSFLIAQCQTLIEVSESITAWNDSKYSKFIRMCNVNTLLELRRHWKLYVQAGQLSSAGKKRLKEMVLSIIRTTKATKHNGSDLLPCRSAGPYFLQSAEPASKVFQHFWKTGITSLGPQDISAATFANPTFVYSLTGEGFALHYGTTPISPFHLAPAFLTSKRNIPTMPELVDCARAQFSSWIKHFRAFVQDKPGKLMIRLFAGDALFFCRALVHHVGTGKIPPDLTVAPWNTAPLALDGGDYGHSDGVPTSFNIIETSNIMDHIGLLNVLVAAIPLLSPYPSATLFTEALLYTGEDATRNFTTQFCADVSTMSLLLDLAPINYLSNFNTRSNAEEILATKFQMSFRQYHERITWKRPMTGDPILVSQLPHQLRIPISFEPRNLGELLFDVYLKMFASDDTMSRLSDPLHSLRDLETVHYIRETFAIFLAIVKRRVNADWDSTMASFFDRLGNDTTLMMGMSNCQDLCTRLYLAGVYTTDFIRTPFAKEGRFRGWTQVPLTVSVILVVPRDKLRVLSDMDPNKLGTPILHGNLHGRITHNIFASLKVGFGKVTASGTDARPKVAFEPDPSSWTGTSPLIVSFLVPSRVLHIENPDAMSVTLSLRSTPQTSFVFMSRLGMALEIFAAPLMDRSQVFVVPDEPRGLDESLDKIFATDNRQEGKLSVTTDPQSRRATTLTARIDITDVPTKSILSSGAEVSSRQVSPCVMEVRIGQTRRSLVYPLPVIGSHSKLRIARKSSYVEVVVPIAEPLQPDGFALNRFPIPLTDKVEAPWNFHHLQLDRLPALNVSSRPRVGWIGPHLGLTMTDRERALREQDIRTDTLTNVKATIHAILVGAAGLQQQQSRAFGLTVKGNTDTVIFIPTLRLDLTSHTLVADAYVLPLNPDRLRKVEKTLAAIIGELLHVELWGDEVANWKRLLPVLAERCRTWKHGPNCEFLTKKSVPLSLEHGNDPLCSCGKGKDVSAAFMKEKKWEPATPFVTRIAIGPIFGVPYIERVGGFADTMTQRISKDLEERRDRCARCGGPGKPKLLVCGACKTTSYCSAGCQKEDWKKHKLMCRK